MLILAILGHLWPVFGQLWPQYQFPKLSLSTFDLVLIGLSEIYKRIPNNYDFSDENANFGHFRSFLACFWPVMTLVSMSTALNEYI